MDSMILNRVSASDGSMVLVVCLFAWVEVKTEGSERRSRTKGRESGKKQDIVFEVMEVWSVGAAGCSGGFRNGFHFIHCVRGGHKYEKESCGEKSD
jgi:hypothetical protein